MINKKSTKILALFIVAFIWRSDVAHGNQRLKAYLSGKKSKFLTEGHPKAQGLKISFEYPEGWELAEGKRPNIIQQFKEKIEGRTASMCLLQVNELPWHVRLLNFFGFDLGIFLPSELRKLVPPEYQFIKGTPTEYEGEKGALLIFSGQVERAGMKVDIYFMQHIFLYSGKLIGLQCSVGDSAGNKNLVALFDEYAPLFQHMGNTIVIHNKWKKS